ncbi:hypothetical protein KFL_002230035 [Klebsormidium nitens]|uniref:RING-type domain-containing protein n=1 Tax=Klebsormidium nitens TaxID=105231 RepID=A0A1Y1I3X1_KLENI|nr:hypothetical protein KFL_002230035 [Klebsormidium nitens]|eukprot:GAQ85183.1 hypothetical protein KFL_002230035 [Klebsormidium nitens]
MHADGSAGSVGIDALRQRNFVKEAVDDVTSCILPFGGKDAIQRALGEKGTELVKHLLGYASGTGEAALRGCPVHFRRMSLQQAGEILNAFCSERLRWLFTWDLLRSPPVHFAVMQTWLERPENEGLGETVRSMALAALRVRAYALGKHYRAAKARLLDGREVEAGREMAHLALAAAVATDEFANCIYRETTEFCGRKYADALLSARATFTDEPAPDTVPVDAIWIEKILTEAEARFAEVPEGHRGWIQTNYDILNGLKPELQAAIEELNFANLVKKIDEGAVKYGTERRSEGCESDPRWVVKSCLNVAVIMKWVRRKLSETGGRFFYGEEYLERVLLGTENFDAQTIFLQLRVAFGDRRAAVTSELCELLASALEAADGIPCQLTEAAEQAAAELLSAESELSSELAPDAKATKKGKKKKKKGHSTHTPGRLPAAAGGVLAGKVDLSGDDVSSPRQLAPGPSLAPPADGADSSRDTSDGKPRNKPSYKPVDDPGDESGVRMAGESEPSSRSGGDVEMGGGIDQGRGERRQGDAEQGPGSAGSRTPSDRPSVGARGRGAVEAADVISGHQEVRGDSSPASTETGPGAASSSSPTHSVRPLITNPPNAPPAAAIPESPLGETKALPPDCCKPNAGGRSDVETLSKSHVAAGERPPGRGRGGTLGGQDSKAGSSSAPATESVTAAIGRQDIQLGPTTTLLAVSTVPALTPKDQADPSGEPQSAESGPRVVQTVRNVMGKRKSNREEKLSGALPGQTKPAVIPSGNGATLISRATAASLSQGSGDLQANPYPYPNTNPNLNPITNPQHSPLTSEASRKPRAPYNPLARARPLTPAVPTGHSLFPEASAVPATPPRGRTSSVDQPTAKNPEPSTSGMDVTSVEASADVTHDVPRLMTGVHSEAAGPGAQRSPEPESFSPELPSILAMLLPVEGASQNVPPPNSIAFSNVYKFEGHRPNPGSDSTGSSHSAHADWVETLESGPDTWGESASVQTKSYIASDRAVGRKKTKNHSGPDKQNGQGSDVCCICFDSPKNGAIVPCGHCLCYECGTLIKEKRAECPFCNTKIESIFRLFL